MSDELQPIARKVIRLPVRLVDGLIGYFEIYEPDWEPFDFEAWWEGLSQEKRSEVALKMVQGQYSSSTTWML